MTIEKTTICQVCIITDIIIDATHKCEVCNLDICDMDNLRFSTNHMVDHMRIDAEATS